MRRLAAALSAPILALLVIVGAGAAGAGGKAVTPVKGPSWLAHLGLAIGATRLGENGGEAPAPPSGREEPMPEVPGAEPGTGAMRGPLGRAFGSYAEGGDQPARERAMSESFTITGADLYRLNCRACHGPGGEGAPPEIASIVKILRATSPGLLEAQGTKLSPEAYAQMEKAAEAPIRRVLAKGAGKMPPFAHLTAEEVESLVMYLKQLAGLPKREWHAVSVSESVARVGEHLMKGTCHLCHGATGAGAGHMAMMRGVVPSLASFPAELPLWAVERKVRRGADTGTMGGGMGGMMGGGMMGGRPRMPVFPYLTQAEVAAGYLYLEAYPPQP